MACPLKTSGGVFKSENNLRITKILSINGNKLPYDLPEATKVDLTIEIDESRNIHIEAYVPSIELTLSDVRVDTYAQEVDTKKLAVELEAQKERLKQVQSSISADEQKKLEDTINSIETNIKNADNDTDDKVRAERDVRELKTDLDKIEKDRTIPQLGEEFYEKLNRMQDSIHSIEDETERALLCSGCPEDY